MITKTFYRYRDGKSLIDTPSLPPKGTVYETLTQVVADSGKVLTDGTTDMGVVITTDISKWTEIVAPPAPPDPLDPVDELPLVKAELDRYKLAVAEVTAINTSTALKTTLVGAVNRLKTAVAEPIVKDPIIADPIVKGAL